MKPIKMLVCTAVLTLGGIGQGCQKNEEGIVIQASPEFIAQEKAERAAIEAAREKGEE